MLSDTYNISSNFRPKKKNANCKVNDFFEKFNNFYIGVRMGSSPDLPHKICDPYGFYMLCQDIKQEEDSFIVQTKSETCKQAYINREEFIKHKPYYGAFSFRKLLDLLYRGYYFDYDLAINVYNMQHNALNIFMQIMNGQGYIMNRLAPNKKKVGKLMNYACDSQISLDENAIIPVPYVHRVCDGKTWPCIISQAFNTAKIVKCDTSGYGEGIFLINENNKLIDCLKINDLWIADTPLENRLTFCTNNREFQIEPYIKAFSWRSAIKAAKTLKCNQNDGILVRPCYENYFKTTWFNWSKNSLIYSCFINGKLQNSNIKSSKPEFYTLEGDGTVGIVNPYEERVTERIWLDDFDIKEFQMVLDL